MKDTKWRTIVIEIKFSKIPTWSLADLNEWMVISRVQFNEWMASGNKEVFYYLFSSSPKRRSSIWMIWWIGRFMEFVLVVLNGVEKPRCIEWWQCNWNAMVNMQPLNMYIPILIATATEINCIYQRVLKYFGTTEILRYISEFITAVSWFYTLEDYPPKRKVITQTT